MQASLETLSALERRLKVAVPVTQINTEVENRLKRLQRTVKLHGFRPGKVPMKVVVQQFGPKVRQEVLGDTVEKTFGEAVREKNLRVAGYPKIEAKPGTDAEAEFEFTATFEVFPDVKIGELSAATIERPMVSVGDAEVEKTIEVLRKQRVRHADVRRPASSGDAVMIDYAGSIDGKPFEGGSAQNQSLVLGEGRLLPDFEAALIGMNADETKSFELTFPADYHGTEVAGKKAQFEIKLHSVQEQILPEVDAEFAKGLGVEDGDLQKMRTDVRANLEREVKRRIQTRVKDQALMALLESATLEVPKSLIDMEIERLSEQMKENLRGRGMKPETMNMPREMFEQEARRRVSIGLILNELVKQHAIKAQPDQIKAMIEEYAESYEHPEEVVRWYYQSGDRVREVEAVVLENNVVEWVLGNAKVVKKSTPFEELMGSAQ